MPSALTSKVLHKVETETPAFGDSHKRKQLFRLLLLTCSLAAINLLLCEIAGRFIVFLGKPAISENPQFQIKYLVAKGISSAQDNVVLCGDSLMKAAIYPELIAAQLGKINDHIRVVNLAVNSATQADAIAYLEYLRTRNIKPRLVVYDYEVLNTGGNTTTVKANSIASNTSATKSKTQEASRGYLFGGLLSRPTEFRGKCEIFIEDCLYLVRHRGNIKRYLLEFLRAIKFPSRFERKAFFELYDCNDIGTTADGMSPNHRLMNGADQERAMQTFHSSSPQSTSYKYIPDAYAPIIEYCQQQEIPLLLVWLPHQSTIYEKFYYRAPYTENWFRQQFAGYARLPGVYPLYLNSLSEDPSYYTDFRHLSTYGCTKASELFADALSQPKYSELLKRSNAQTSAH